MNILKAKKADFYTLPKIKWNEDMEDRCFDSIIILPERRKHESGYMCMSFVGCVRGDAVAIMSGVSDVLHLDGIGGYGKNWIYRYNGIPASVPPKHWNMDCLPCGCLHIWADNYQIEIGSMLSSFEIFAEPKRRGGK